MQVYTLPNDKPDYKVLICGDFDFTIEFADVLLAAGIEYAMMPPFDSPVQPEEVSIEDVLSGEEFLITEFDREVYGVHSKFFASSIDQMADDFTHIVELGLGSLSSRAPMIQMMGMLNPTATIITSSITNTATEIGFVSQSDSRIVGCGLAPFLMSAATAVDIAKGLNCEIEYLTEAAGLMRAAGYDVEVVEDRVGLVQMRVLAMLINEAAFALMEGVATAEDIDSAMKLGVNYPMGLLQWCDEIGLPVIALVLDGLYGEYQQERYRTCALIKQHMRAGWHGRSVGRGFYSYED